ncbi:MAG: hypothetical protein H7Z40_02835 [Phycisphaerae bacterium]|nr:hypothetical protein [Gemmatimonadaceae bacterium]
MKSLVRAFLVGACVATQAHAHPIHTTLTKVSVERNAITFNVRTFADDFSATVAKFSGRAAPRDSSVSPAEVLRYAQSFFTVTSASGTPLVLEACGIKRANELYWLCFRVTVPSGSQGARVRNQMLTELHGDQVNIVQTEPPAARRTMLFTKGSPFAVVGP